VEKVIFDTNAIRDKEPKNFLGNRSELEKFLKVAQIVFPNLVIEEIKHQKRRNLTSKKQAFLDNPFHWIKKLDVDETKGFDIEEHIASLEKGEKLEYSVIELTDYSVLEQMRELALKKQAPFDAGEKTDKGFKDAYIYFTILEYLQSTSDKVIFVCTKDGRLKEALEEHPSIIVIKNYDEFIQKSVTKYFDDYFIKKLQADINTNINKKCIVDYWVNINENRVLLIDVEDEKIVVEVDSGEIIDYKNVGDYSVAIINLINSNTFLDTHTEIDALNLYLHFLSDEEIIRVLGATIENGQISSIISDDDVKQFVSTLYEKKKGILSLELGQSVKDILGLR